jgi:hypothetical protein
MMTFEIPNRLPVR